MAKKYRAVKFGGDDEYSWAVFRSQDIKGLRSPITEDDTNVKPFYSGCNRSSAQAYVRLLEVKNGN